ncbi:DUF3168 domain-containing protein [Psychromarinibacter halotolerans]|uniref:DUF3168 domain-containing protein n=1 Tax=Psychromarinibacter halotolerans TaxID=1775175 RepID=A0ABV7GXN1_9RHOB|nr:DUF3168 domain-containing protein [Psychromarinibacter halotolerans]MDF0598988.1 DUF3168 domain-containing protein [Psychromarinibacter halotolerans]
MGPTRALQAAIYEALLSSPAVTEIVGDRIFDAVPQSARNRFPRITFGPSDGLDAETDCVPADDLFFQIDCWTRADGRLGPCRDLAEAVRDALHQVPIYAALPFAITSGRVARVRVFEDPDGETGHGVVSFEATVERL